jgi:hypothetical protein
VAAEGATAVRSNAVTVTVNPEYADYFGEWKFTAPDSRWMAVSISADKLTRSYYDGRSYTLENLTWEEKTEPKNNAEYPTGYRIIGTLTANEQDVSPNRPDLSGNADIGEQGVVFWYMATGKNSLAEGSGFVTYHAADTDYIFIRQSNQ